jgi:hypothetical protein
MKHKNRNLFIDGYLEDLEAMDPQMLTDTVPESDKIATKKTILKQRFNKKEVIG